MHRIHCSLLLATAAAFSSCANYDFAKARLPNGEPDVTKLIADLKESKEEQLTSMLWIPLIYLDLQTFKPAGPGHLNGYTLVDAQGYGPLFCVGAVDRVVVDDKGGPIEDHDYFWCGWGIGYHGHDERIETKVGHRQQDDWRVALLFGRDDVCHVPAK